MRVRARLEAEAAQLKEREKEEEEKKKMEKTKSFVSVQLAQVGGAAWIQQVVTGLQTTSCTPTGKTEAA